MIGFSRGISIGSTTSGAARGTTRGGILLVALRVAVGLTFPGGTSGGITNRGGRYGVGLTCTGGAIVIGGLLYGLARPRATPVGRHAADIVPGRHSAGGPTVKGVDWGLGLSTRGTIAGVAVV